MEQLDDALGLQVPVAALPEGRGRVFGVEVPQGLSGIVGITAGQAGSGGAHELLAQSQLGFVACEPGATPCVSAASLVQAGEDWAVSLSPHGERPEIWDLQATRTPCYCSYGVDCLPSAS